MDYAKRLLVQLLRYGNDLKLEEAKRVEHFDGDFGKLSISLPDGKAYIIIEQKVYNNIMLNRGVK